MNRALKKVLNKIVSYSKTNYLKIIFRFIIFEYRKAKDHKHLDQVMVFVSIFNFFKNG